MWFKVKQRRGDVQTWLAALLCEAEACVFLPVEARKINFYLPLFITIHCQAFDVNERFDTVKRKVGLRISINFVKVWGGILKYLDQCGKTV